ncbi:hypothetical protein AK812_SmicGene9238 [Symbiodinium microadriaticum]|uniref:C3H1-type domain-containing protein n=1 Tax=Symbiodinium microadriaticum TaxID=2951 RepID=A0A1Q9EIY1_SYMMI|nr:hypothetical protein AK812_SmicGene9238 [Symbiodinium microadriaticum]
MALELEYRNTFIDVKEDFEEMGSSRARAQSSPPGRVRRISFSLEAASEEDAMRSYVGTLSQKTADLMKLQDETPTTACSSSPKSPMSPEVLEVEPEHPPILAEFFPLLPSQGSLGHPEVCRRPCIYFIAGHCENGNACAYCHMEHTEKTPKLDKRQRTIIQALSRPQLLGLVLHFCRSKAEQAGFLEEAAEILGMLAQESAGARPLSQMVSDRDLRNLHKTLGRMNFSNLIGLVTHQSSNRTGNATPSADFLAASLERIARIEPWLKGMRQLCIYFHGKGGCCYWDVCMPNTTGPSVECGEKFIEGGASSLKEGMSIMPYREPATGERHELDLVNRLTGAFPMTHRSQLHVNAVVSSYAESGRWLLALHLLDKADLVGLNSALAACDVSAAWDQVLEQRPRKITIPN